MTLYRKQNPETIQEMFDSIADNYDITNARMSFNMHKRWNRTLVDAVLRNGRPKQYLDLCCGTGEIAAGVLEQMQEPCEAFCLDFSQEMLQQAKKKLGKRYAAAHTVRYLKADAQDIPLPAESIDTATVAYGIRNVQNPQTCFKDVHRVLRRGGFFAILELTQPSNRMLRAGHTVYLRFILPLIGQWATKNKGAYEYLSQSIQSFIPPQELEQMLRSAGFQDIKRHALLGGVATLLTAKK